MNCSAIRDRLEGAGMDDGFVDIYRIGFAGVWLTLTFTLKINILNRIDLALCSSYLVLCCLD